MPSVVIKCEYYVSVPKTENISNKSNKSIFTNFFDLLLYVFCGVLIFVIFSFFVDSFSLFAKFSKIELLNNFFNNDVLSNNKLIPKTTLNINSEFLNKNNLLSSNHIKDIVQSFESRFGFGSKQSAYSNVCLKQCLELVNLDLGLQNPYLKILSNAYESGDCGITNSAYPFDIKNLVYIASDPELETLISNVTDELTSSFENSTN